VTGLAVQFLFQLAQSLSDTADHGFQQAFIEMYVFAPVGGIHTFLQQTKMMKPGVYMLDQVVPEAVSQCEETIRQWSHLQAFQVFIELGFIQLDVGLTGGDTSLGLVGKNAELIGYQKAKLGYQTDPVVSQLICCEQNISVFCIALILIQFIDDIVQPGHDHFGMWQHAILHDEGAREALFDVD